MDNGDFWTREALGVMGAARDRLHARAREARRTVWKDRVFVRGVIEVSNYCRENCRYCGMRRAARGVPRQRLALEELRGVLERGLPECVTDLNVQAGEDPVVVREVVVPFVREVTRHTRLGVSVCLGTLAEDLFRELYEAGARYYIMKLETGVEALYRRLEAPGTLQERMEAIRHLAARGWHVSSGFIMGLPGDGLEGAWRTMELLRGLPLSGWSVSPFIPGEDTPLAGMQPGDLGATLNTVAMMRLARPEWIVPAISAMNLLSPEGYGGALQAGANLVTVNLTPAARRGDYRIYKKERIIVGEAMVLREIERAGCRPSPTGLVEELQRRHGGAAFTRSRGI